MNNLVETIKNNTESIERLLDIIKSLNERIRLLEAKDIPNE